MSSPRDMRQLSTVCTDLVSSSKSVEEAVLEFVRYYPSSRQDVAGLAREISDVRLAATLLLRNGEDNEGRRSGSVAPPNLQPSIVSVAGVGVRVVEEISEILRRPDRSREGWLQDVASNLSDMASRVEVVRMGLNVGLDALLLNNAGPASNQADLPPYQSTQIVEEILAIRIRILEVNERDDPRVHEQTSLLREFLDVVQAYTEQTSSSLAIPSITPDGRAPSRASARSDVASAYSYDASQPPPAVEPVPISFPAPERIVMRHLSKIEVGNNEITQLQVFNLRSQPHVAVSFISSSIQMFSIRGTALNLNSQAWGRDMVFSAGAPLWAYLSDQKRQNAKYNRLLREDNYVKEPCTCLYNLTLGTKMQQITGVYAKPLALSHDGAYFVLTKPGGRLRVMNLKNTQATNHQVVSNFHTEDVTHAVFTPDTRSLISVSRDGTIRVMDSSTGEPLAKLDVDTWKAPQLLGITPDGNVIVSVWGDTVYRWDYDTGSLDTYVLGTRRRQEGRPIAISPDCRFLVCTSYEGIDVSDLHTGRVLHTLRLQAGFVTAAAFSQDGRYLALGKAAAGGLTVTSSTLDVWEITW